MSKNVEINVQTEQGYESLYPKSLAKNVYMSENGNNLNDEINDIYVDMNNIYTDDVFEVGDILCTCRSNVGSKWLECDGSSVYDSKYSTLASFLTKDASKSINLGNINNNINESFENAENIKINKIDNKYIFSCVMSDLKVYYFVTDNIKKSEINWLNFKLSFSNYQSDEFTKAGSYYIFSGMYNNDITNQNGWSPISTNNRLINVIYSGGYYITNETEYGAERDTYWYSSSINGNYIEKSFPGYYSGQVSLFPVSIPNCVGVIRRNQAPLSEGIAQIINILTNTVVTEITFNFGSSSYVWENQRKNYYYTDSNTKVVLISLDKDDYTKAYTSAIVFNSNSTINLVRNFVSASFPSSYIYNPRSYNGTQNYSTGTEITTSGGLVAFNWNGAMVENTYNLGYTSDIYFRVGFNLNSKDFFNYKSSGFTLNSITGIYLYNLAVLPNFTSVSTSNTKEKYYIKAEL